MAVVAKVNASAPTTSTDGRSTPRFHCDMWALVSRAAVSHDDLVLTSADVN